MNRDVGEDIDEAEGAAAGATRIVVSLEEGAAAARLDAALASRVPDMSRSRLKALILDGRVTIGGATVDDPSRRVNAGDEITVEIPAPEAAEPQGEAIPLDIVFEDDAVIVIDKPAGLVVHPGAGNWTGTLVNALIHHCGSSLSGIGGVLRPGIVHRLDKDTSGVMVVAKSDKAHRKLSAQFADHGVEGPLERAYWAVVWGLPRQRAGTIVTRIGRDPRNRETMAVLHGEAGREAVTHYEVLEVYGEADTPIASLIECRLETGRTHQIRVHMAHLGHPLLGDAVYGAGFRTKLGKLERAIPAAKAAVDALGRQALHARLLAFAHPMTGETMLFEREPPADMERLIDVLRAGA